MFSRLSDSPYDPLLARPAARTPLLGSLGDLLRFERTFSEQSLGSISDFVMAPCSDQSPGIPAAEFGMIHPNGSLLSPPHSPNAWTRRHSPESRTSPESRMRGTSEFGVGEFGGELELGLGRRELELGRPSCEFSERRVSASSFGDRRVSTSSFGRMSTGSWTGNRHSTVGRHSSECRGRHSTVSDEQSPPPLVLVNAEYDSQAADTAAPRDRWAALWVHLLARSVIATVDGLQVTSTSVAWLMLLMVADGC